MYNVSDINYYNNELRVNSPLPPPPLSIKLHLKQQQYWRLPSTPTSILNLRNANLRSSIISQLSIINIKYVVL